MYTIVIHKNEDCGLWCAAKHYEDSTVGTEYAFAVSPKAVEFKLEDDGEERENIIFDD